MVILAVKVSGKAALVLFELLINESRIIPLMGRWAWWPVASAGV